MSHPLDGLAYQLQPMFDARGLELSLFLQHYCIRSWAFVPIETPNSRKQTNDYCNTPISHVPTRYHTTKQQIEFSSLKRASWYECTNNITTIKVQHNCAAGVLFPPVTPIVCTSMEPLKTLRETTPPSHDVVQLPTLTVVITQVILQYGCTWYVVSSLSIFTRCVCGSVPNSSTGTLFMISEQDRGYKCTHRRRATLSSRLRKIKRRGGKKQRFGYFLFLVSSAKSSL